MSFFQSFSIYLSLFLYVSFNIFLSLYMPFSISFLLSLSHSFFLSLTLFSLSFFSLFVPFCQLDNVSAIGMLYNIVRIAARFTTVSNTSFLLFSGSSTHIVYKENHCSLRYAQADVRKTFKATHSVNIV